jgi:DMSO/TMAO reductase YedYZ molybdopterin-dependent catalytic subunit
VVPIAFAGKHTGNQPTRLAHLDHGNDRAILAQVVWLEYLGTPSVTCSDDGAISSTPTPLAWAQNGQLLEHLHGALVCLLVPGWSGNWSVKWLTKLGLMEQEPDCWYHYQFYYYGTSLDDPNKELITTIGVKSIITQPNDDTETMSPGVHMKL